MKIDGWKTYLVGGVMVLVGAVELAGYDVVPSVDKASAFDYIMAGLAIITGRSALKKLEN